MRGEREKEPLFIWRRDRKFFLKEIEETDIEFIREIKNRNKDRFFFQQIISAQQQREWYAGYLLRKDDYIFVVGEESERSDQYIGCLGFRKLQDKVDIYNVIRGNPSTLGITMKEAMQTMVAYIHDQYHYAINCEVLKDNPAVFWYQNCGFEIVREYDIYYDMIPTKIKKINYQIGGNRND